MSTCLEPPLTTAPRVRASPAFSVVRTDRLESPLPEMRSNLVGALTTEPPAFETVTV